MPRFIYNQFVIDLTHKQCIDMELYLNKDKKRSFIQLGDKLYNAGIGKINLEEITMSEYDILQKISSNINEDEYKYKK